MVSSVTVDESVDKSSVVLSITVELEPSIEVKGLVVASLESIELVAVSVDSVPVELVSAVEVEGLVGDDPLDEDELVSVDISLVLSNDVE